MMYFFILFSDETFPYICTGDDPNYFGIFYSIDMIYELVIFII